MNELIEENEILSHIAAPLLFWYDDNARILPWRETPTPYRIWISEVILQQTRVEAGKAYFERFVSELPTITALAEVSNDKLMKLWEGLGYYNRARNLKRAAKMLMAEFDGELPADYDKLLTLPGIGLYTAGAIGSIAFGLPVPCVDGNVLRVFTRLTTNNCNIAEAKVKRVIGERISAVIPRNRPGDFNQSLMELGATICIPNGAPNCGCCPLSSLCKSFSEGSMLQYPVKPEKKPRKIENRTILIIISNQTVALQKREDSGLLAGFFEFPNLKGHLYMSAIREKLLEMGFARGDCLKIKRLKNAKHIFSHIEWIIHGYLILCAKDIENSQFTWASRQQLEDEIALPSAYQLYYQTALEQFSKPVK